ncbi:MAG TPA: IPT/TIG domain-containing protein [Frankiaceae bacterium]|nr:IPT/TIG domain-containing protein [Frankiaceae bacterium]
MNRLHNAVRRSGVVVAAALALAGLPAGPTVAATGTITSASPAFVANTGAETSVTFALSAAPMSPGEVLNVELSGPAGSAINETGTPEVDGSSVTATFDLRGASPGVYGVTIADATGGTVDEFTCASCLRVLATPPTVSAVSPTVRGASSPGATFTVTGTNFFDGASVRFLRDGANDSAITFPSSGSLTVGASHNTISGLLAVGAGAVPGTRDVEVTNTDGQRALCVECLTVTAAPSYVSLTPSTAGQGAVARSLALVGADFQPSMSATFYMPSSDTDLGGVTVTSFSVTEDGAATITANVADRGDTVNTTRDLVLRNPDGGTTRVANALTVTPEPVVSALTPSTLDGGAEGEDLVVTGTGLSSAPAFVFSGTGVTVNGYTPDASTPSTKGVLNVTTAPGATVAGRTITVENPDGGRSTSGTVLTVGATPTVTEVTPRALGRGASGRPITIKGTNFDTSNGGTAVAVTIPGITLSGVVATSTTTITANASVPGTAEVGTLDVSVLNTAAGRRGRATCAGCFSVDTFSVDSVTPSAVLNSATYLLDVTGSGLPVDKEITATLTRNVARAGQDPIVFDGTTNSDGTRFAGSVDLRQVAPGAYTLRLADGDAVGTCTCTFSVVAETAPVLTSVTPSSAPQGTTGRELTLKGSGFTRGTDVRFGTGVTKAGDVTFVDATTLTVPVDVAQNATVGAVPVTVMVPSFGSDTESTCAACFSVTKSPTVTSVSRASRGQGAPAIGITVTGTDFAPGATVSAGDGVEVTDVLWVSATQMTFTATIAGDAVPGPRTVTVTNPDGGAGSCACFAVTPRPQTASIAPPGGAQGSNGVEVVLSGTGYQNGAGVSFGDDVIVSSVTGSGETLTATLDLRAANTGAHPVVVTNPDGGTAACECVFTVSQPPTITGLTPASRGAGSVNQPVTIMGSKFADSATVSFAEPGITVVDTDVVDESRIDVVLSIAGDVAPGTRSVTVTNLDSGQSANCAACFTVNPKPALDAAAYTAQRNRDAVVVMLSGSGFQPGAVGADLGDDITVTDAQALTASSVRVTFDVGDDASLGARDITVVNGDGGRATCASCLTVTTPRVFTVAGDTSPTSGDAESYTVTAHVSSAEDSATDTSYTGVPVLSADGDEKFSGGTCAAAVNGVSTCSGVVFGDLGDALLNVSGTGGDADLGGTRAVTVEPVSLTFSPAAPKTAQADSPVSFTVRPVAGVSGASISGYDAARTAHVTGSSPSTVPLNCGSAVCTFTLTFGSTGSKTVRVSDDGTPSVSTPTTSLTVGTGTKIEGFRVSASRLVAGQSITMRGSLLETDGTPLAGSTVRLYVKGGGFRSWVLWHSVTTDGAGAFAKTARMTRTRSIKAVYLPPNASYTRSESPVKTVLVATRVTVTSPDSGTRVAAGRTFTVRGTTYPGKPGVTAYLFWRKADGSVAVLRRAEIARNGSFALSRSLPRGTYTLQVGVPATVGNTSGRSALFTLRVV